MFPTGTYHCCYRFIGPDLDSTARKAWSWHSSRVFAKIWRATRIWGSTCSIFFHQRRIGQSNAWSSGRDFQVSKSTGPLTMDFTFFFAGLVDNFVKNCWFSTDRLEHESIHHECLSSFGFPRKSQSLVIRWSVVICDLHVVAFGLRQMLRLWKFQKLTFGLLLLSRLFYMNMLLTHGEIFIFWITADYLKVHLIQQKKVKEYP